MMKAYTLITLTLFVLGCGLKEQTKELNNVETFVSDTLTYEKENFNVFLSDFSMDSTFQLSRIIFPFKDCYVEPTGDSLCEVIENSKWSYLQLVDDGNITTIRNTNSNENSDERIFSIEGVENGVGSYYYFEREDGKWYLKRRLTYE